MDKLIQVEHKYRHQLKRSGVFSDIEETVEAYALGKLNILNFEKHLLFLNV